MKSVATVAIFWLLVTAFSAACAREPQPGGSPQAAEFFETRVRPVLAEHCHSCHGPTKQKAGLRLDSRAALLKGGDDGPVVIPGQPNQSALVRAIRYSGDVRMPPKGKLPAEVIAALTAWVKMGVPWPESDKTAPGKTETAITPSKHWAFQPVRKPSPPAVKDEQWVRTTLDRFVLARLKSQGLAPAKQADRRTLIRRVSFDLIGLPPTSKQVAVFEADSAPNAYEKLVDRLLACPHYGERWGRHWLDVARYADTKGYVFLEERRYPYAYTYRDYVIRAFNEDLPYDQFIVEQLAADRLPSTQDKRSLAALGFLTLGRRFLNNPHDIIDDRIDVVSRGLLGLTVTCARCHDHKFDPIPQRDYYSLYGVFASSREPRDLPLLGEPPRTPAYLAFDKELRARQRKMTEFLEAKRAEVLARKPEVPRKVTLQELPRFFDRAAREQLTGLRRRVEEWQASSPAAPPRAMVLEDAAEPVTPHVFKRGNPNMPGDEVPRQFLLVLAGAHRQPFHEGSGRLELARAIVDKSNPLTARVLVNRVWQHHFGAGLVRTSGDFGTRGEPATHPELLDYLAATFVESGWSIKKLHRLILLSSVYQQASDDNPAGEQLDPENRLLWRMNRQRLDFEELRDSLLAVAGRLDTTAGGPAVDLTTAPFSTRRSVYGFIDRQNLPGLFRTFDFASPDTTTPQRHTTTVPQQALFLMNSPFVAEQARHLIRRPEIAAAKQPTEKIQRLYQILYGRAADADEVSMGLRFLAEGHEPDKAGKTLGAWEELAQVLLLTNEAAFVD
jgi:hypothetical protein